jgi:WD40 repeat protein
MQKEGGREETVSIENHQQGEVSRGKRLALVVGVDHLPKSAQPSLRSACRDAVAIGRTLEAQCHFTLLCPPLLDEQATSTEAKRAILTLARGRTSNDQLLFYFSGHGIVMDVEAERQEVYLGTYDFSEEEVEEAEELHLSLSWLRDKLYRQTEAGKVVLLLDCCYSGQMGSIGPDSYLQELQQRISYYFHHSSPRQETRFRGLRQALTATGHGTSTTQEGPEHGHLTERLLPILRGQVPEALGLRKELTLPHLYASLADQYAQQGLPLPSLSGDPAGHLYILASFSLSQNGSTIFSSAHRGCPATYLPFPRNPHFQPRPGEFEKLEDLLFASGSLPVRLGLIGVTGMGGVGKTQLAIELAYRYQHRFPDGIFWMPATGQNIFAWQQTLAELAEKIHYLPPEDNPAHPDVQFRARYLARYFATHAEALVILDNVEAPESVSTMLTELAGEALACHVLYTSRQQMPLVGVITYAVPPLSPEGAWRLLLAEKTRRALLVEVLAGNTSMEVQAVRTLCQQTGYLPLALTHLQKLLAEDQHVQVQDLVVALHQRGVLSLTDSQSHDPRLEETFLLSWQQVGEERARQCFLLASLFTEAIPIPLWLLGLAAGLGESSLPFDPLWEVSLRLQDLSLLEVLSGEQVRLHPLVQAFGQHLLGQEEEKGHTLRTQAGQRLAVAFCDLTLLELRARRMGYRACLEQVRFARDYAIRLDTSHADQLIRLESAMDRESYLLADKRWWPETLPSLFYQQLFNLAVETNDTFPSQQFPLCWIQQMGSVGTTDQALLRILSGHEKTIRSVAFSPDGQMVLTGSDDDTARLWECSTGKLHATLTGGGRQAVFSPDGRLVVTDSDEETALLWQSSTGHLLATLEAHTNLEEIGLDDAVTSVAFSPDGRFVLISSYDGTARLWECSTGKLHATLQDDTDETEGIYSSVAFSPDGQLVVTGSSDDTARIWECSAGTLRVILQGHISSLTGMAFSPDGQMVLTGSYDKTARLWDSSTGKLLVTLQGHNGPVSSVAFSPDGQMVLTASSEDGTARLWESCTGKLRTILRHTHQVTSVAFSPDGRLVVTGSWDQKARLWDSSTGKLQTILQGHVSSVESVAFSPDGRQVLTGSGDKTARLWDSSYRQRQTPSRDPWRADAGWISSVTFSPGGRLVLTGSYDGKVHLWRSSSGRHQNALEFRHFEMVSDVAFSPDGRLVLSGSHDKTAQLWDSNTGRHRATLKGHTDRVECVAFSPDGKLVVTGSYDKTACLWESSTGQFLATLEGHTYSVESVAFSPDGRQVLTGSSDYTARLWDSSTGKLLTTLNDHTSVVDIVGFSPDGKLVATGSRDQTARLWDSCTGKLLTILDDHTSSVNKLVFSPDGQLMLTGSSDGIVHLWKSSTGQHLATMDGHTNWITNLAFSPNGQLVLTSDASGWTFFWQLLPRDKILRLGLYITSDHVSSLFWQDMTHLLLADPGRGSGRPFVYHVHLEGSCWQSK